MNTSIKTKSFTLFNKFLTYFRNKHLKPTYTFTNELYIINILSSGSSTDLTLIGQFTKHFQLTPTQALA